MGTLILCLFSILLILTVKKTGNLLSPAFIFLSFIGVFILGKIILEELFDYGSVESVRYFVSIDFSKSVKDEIYFVIMTMLLSLLISVQLPFKIKLASSLNGLPNLNYWLLFLISVPLILYYLQRFLFVVDNGYYAFQLGEFGGKPIPIFFLEQFYWLLTLKHLLCQEKSEVLRRFIILLFPILLLEILSGKRGTAAVNLLVILLFFQYNKIIRLRFVGVLIIGIGFTTLLNIIGQVRHSSERSVDLGLELAGLRFLDERASALNTLGFAIKNKDNPEVENFNVLNVVAELRDLGDKFRRRLFGMRELTLEEKFEKYGYSGYVITDQIDNTLMSEGKTYGTSFLTELWLLGGIFSVGLGSFVIYRMILSWSFAFSEKSIFILTILPDMLYLPRMSLSSIILPNIVMFGTILILAIINYRRI